MTYKRSMTEYDEVVGASIYYVVAERIRKKLRADIATVGAATLILKDEVGRCRAEHGGPSGIRASSDVLGMELDLVYLFPDIADRVLFSNAPENSAYKRKAADLLESYLKTLQDNAVET